MDKDVDEITKDIIGAAIEVHKVLGPGLLESAYEACLCEELLKKGVSFKRQCVLEVNYKGTKIDCGYRLDLLVENKVIVELKSVDKLIPLHDAQLISYLRLCEMSVGLLINFNVLALRHGIRRKVLNYESN
jgi:GxxExxY protein